MEQDAEDVKLRNSRTPKNIQDNAVRISLLSESTSGIVKGEEEDVTSIESSSFSSTDMGDKRERVLTVISKDNLQNKHDFNDVGANERKTNHVTIHENPTEERALLSSHDMDNNASPTNVVENKVKIPDGGWGWVVVLSSFIISMIADGISFSFGLLYIEFLEEFQASKSTTAWIGSLFIAVPLLSGPVMSALVDRYGCRSMTILGGIISTLGFVLASISTTLEMMMITFGVIAGLGLGLVYVTAVVSIAYWFEKKRNLAVGLGACGTGVGTFVYAPMTQYFIEEYGWRGAILLLSGTLLNLCVCGCVMRDPEWWILEQKKTRDEEKRKDEIKSKNSSSVSIDNAYAFDFDAATKGKSMKGLIERGLSPEKVIKTEAASIKRHQSMLQTKKEASKAKCGSMVDIPTYLTFNDRTSMKMLDKLVKNTSKDYEMEVKCPSFAINRTGKKTPSSIATSPATSPLEDNSPPAVAYVKQPLQRTHSDRYDFKKEKSFEEYQLKNPNQAVFTPCKSEESKILVKQDSKENRRDWLKKQLSVNHHYLKDLKMPITSISHRNAMLNIKGYRLKASSCPDVFKNSMITIKEEEEKWYDDCVVCLSDMFNVDLFKKPTFNLLCLGTIILFIWFIVPYFYLAEHMVQKGYNEDDGAHVLSLIGITNTIGMVGLGWIGDFPTVSIGNLYSVCLIFCGASVAAIPFAVYNYWVLMTVSGAFGLLFAASFTFTPSLLVKLVSLDDFTAAYGLVLLAQGIGHLIGPPLSGLIFDLTFSWELSFYLAGAWIVVAGLLIAFIQPALNYAQKKEDDNRSESSMA